ncbi:MAG: 30S ribosomal protein S6 [Flavobacteriales bacterium]|jgi:small subunit ribosomal protein S6|nr:30S ribosomal protein S6 [Flavobacteriales bacterium]
MNRYETVFIMTPVLSEEQAAETVDKFKKFLKGKGAKIKHEENWGLRKLAYPIQKKTTGFYQLLEFEAPGESIGPFETEFRRDERILRFLTTAMDKYHVQYAESRRNKAKDKKEKSSEAKAEA